jgi:hypothetical protein
MLRILPLMLALLPVAGIAQQQDNVSIEKKIITFDFTLGKKEDAPVIIKEESITTYRAKSTDKWNNAEYFDNYTVIDDLEIAYNKRSFSNLYQRTSRVDQEGIFSSDAMKCVYEIDIPDSATQTHIRVKKLHNDPKYFTMEYLTDFMPIKDLTIKFIVPDWMKLDLKDFNFGNLEIKRSVESGAKGGQVIVYKASNLPAMVSEKLAPGYTYSYPHIMILPASAETEAFGKITYFKTVQDQYNWYKSLVKQLNNDAGYMKTKSDDIVKGLTNELDKVKAIFSFVQSNIRYLAKEDGIAGFKPAEAKFVYDKRYGDCKGMANLTKNLLKAQGFDARLCWIGTNHIAHDYSTPSLSVDNHMICALLMGGKTYYLDATETNIGFNEYAERIQNRQVLIEDGSKYILDRVPSVVAAQNLHKEKNSISVSANGFSGTASHIIKGESRSSMLSSIQGIKKNNLTEALTNYLSEDNQDYQINELVHNDFLGKDTALTFKYKIDFKRGVSNFGNELYFEPDYRKDLDGFIIDTAKRKNDVVLYHKMTVDQETEFTLPTGYKVSFVPTDLQVSHPNGDIKLSFQRLAGKIIYRKTLRITDVYLKKDQIQDWNNMIEQLSNKYKELITLTK